ncbi:MAG TPA: metal-dependent transcriptional regulator [Epulopiscium sp.]|nr:metal-dependent transcriptional regulator [Candidatus Epulonipiscium sp.]
MSVNRQDYIKTIYELGGEKNRIATKDIARELKVSPPSVSEMIKKLVKEEYLEYELYKGVKLTTYGLEKALEIKKKHLLWEVFLVEKLKYDWEDVHEVAEMLEHITSPKLEERLEEYLDYPEICPHGTPIRNNGYLFNDISLDQINSGESLVIKRLADDKEILRYAKLIDLNIGDKITVLGKDSKGNIKIKNKEKKIEIKFDLAKKIYVDKGMLE